ncbi:hypothetical protein ACFX2F_013549 [Malus domestica]
MPSQFFFGNSHENYPVGHPSWDCPRANSLNFGVSMELEASELLKGLVLGRDENIHIRHIGSTTFGNVGRYNPPPLGARRPRRHTFSQGLALMPNCHIPTRGLPYPGLDSAVARYCPLWAPTRPQGFVSGNSHENFQWVTHQRIALVRTRLTSEFRWNPKLVSSQKVSC